MILIRFKLANYTDKNDTVYINPEHVAAVSTDREGRTCICIAGNAYDDFYTVDGTVDEVAERLRAAWEDAGCAI